MIATVAIVVPHSPPPPSSQQTLSAQCKYSIRQTYDTYVCYTEEEYQAKLLAEQQANDRANAELQQSFMFVLHNWWKFLIGLIVSLIVWAIVSFALYKRDLKRNPHKYDENGFERDWYL